MIFDDDDLELTRQQLARAEGMLASLRSKIQPVNPARFRLWAEPYIHEIRALRRDIDVYLGVEADAATAPTENGNSVEERGTIREIDLDRRTFMLRDRGGTLPDLECEYDAGLEPVVKQFLDTSVIVAGTMRTSRKTERQTLEVESLETALPDDERAAGAIAETAQEAS
jgi:hypothetical protein